jgi:hypothetical protein
VLTGIIGARRVWTVSMTCVVDALEIDAGDAEVAVLAELARDDDERHAFVRHFNGVGVPQLVRREARRIPAGDGRPA